jgi:hypothetical protein
MKRSELALVAAVILFLAGIATGQESMGDFMGMPYSVPDSQVARALTLEAERSAANGHWDKAVIALQKVIDHHEKDVVLDGPPLEARFIGTRVWAHRFIESLPAAGREAYRTHTALEASRSIARAGRTRDAKLLT